MTLSRKSKGFGFQDLVANGIEIELQDYFPGSLAICEPWFDEGSMILSRGLSAFKVRVINDQTRCLVALFEMARVDTHGLFELVTSDDPSGNENTIAMLDGKSPFLESMNDVVNGIGAFFTCIKSFDLSRDAVLETEESFVNAIHEIHCTLETVLIENLPVEEIIPRFDKPYTMFFITSREAMSMLNARVILPCLASLKGRLLVQCNLASIDTLSTLFIAGSKNRLMLAFELRGERGACYVGFKARA
ncbi:MAG TPA: hypothetical protein VKM55_05475 [Candidatus Lokiarchaeia archaeon]|nr:hypothetical protein [Candidatus Lokiarchaeia archaeon]